jgi:dTDP-4-dehydrorhamnose 3,5-epimerase
MKAIPTDLPDVILLEPHVFYDARGFFMETYHERKLAELGITSPFVQDNHSRSQRGTLRGLHYQIRQTQGKLVRVVSGEIFDVAVDLRRQSPTFALQVHRLLRAGMGAHRDLERSADQHRVAPHRRPAADPVTQGLAGAAPSAGRSV